MLDSLPSELIVKIFQQFAHAPQPLSREEVEAISRCALVSHRLSLFAPTLRFTTLQQGKTYYLIGPAASKSATPDELRQLIATIPHHPIRLFSTIEAAEKYIALTFPSRFQLQSAPVIFTVILTDDKKALPRKEELCGEQLTGGTYIKENDTATYWKVENINHLQFIAATVGESQQISLSEEKRSKWYCAII